jgi:hypothetical protein
MNTSTPRRTHPTVFLDFEQANIKRLVSSLEGDGYGTYLTWVGASGLGILSPHNRNTESHLDDGPVTPSRLQGWVGHQGMGMASDCIDRTGLSSRVRALRRLWSGWRVGEGGCVCRRGRVKDFPLLISCMYEYVCTQMWFCSRFGSREQRPCTLTTTREGALADLS